MAGALQSIKIAAEKLKNQYTLTPLECSLREATNNENWNTDTKILQEIADATYNYNDFNVVTKFIWERLTSKSKNWRQVVKTLNMIEYLLKNGAPRCINEFRDEIFQIRSFNDFQCFDEGVDRGASVRERSKAIVELLNDESQLDQERDKSKQIREKLSGIHGLSEGAHERPKYDGFSNQTFKQTQQESPYRKQNAAASTNTQDSDKHYDDVDYHGNLDRFRKKEEKEKEKQKEKEKKIQTAVPSQKEEQKPQPAFQSSVFQIPKPGEDGQFTVLPAPQKTTAAPTSSNQNSLLDFDEPKAPAAPAKIDPFGNWGEVKATLSAPETSNNKKDDFSWGWDLTTNQKEQVPQPSAPADVWVPQPITLPHTNPQPVNFNISTTTNPVNTAPNNSSLFNFNSPPVPTANNNNYNNTSSPFNFTMVPAPPVANSAAFNFTPAPVVNSQVNNKQQSSDDGFSNFESASQKEALLPGLNQREARIIDLSNLKQQDIQKKEEKNNSKTINGLDQPNNYVEQNMLFTTKEELDSFSMFGSPSKPVAPVPPTFHQAPNYSALYVNSAPAQNFGYNQSNMMMYPNNMGMQGNVGMGYAPTGGYNQVQMGGGMNPSYGNNQSNYSNPNAFNFH